MLSQQEDDMEPTPNAALHIVPNRLQHFQFESVSFRCEGLGGSPQIRGIRKTEEFTPVCDIKRTSEGSSCTVDRVYQGDSGSYWCETEQGDRSDVVNITVTAGSVILESPVLPVTEGNNVTLKCRTKKTSSDVAAHFYKDGLLVGSSSAGEMVLHNVSGSDEGLYKCSISSVGESPQSWLAVRDPLRPSSDDSMPVSLVLRTVFVVLLLSLMLLLVGLLHFGKLGFTEKLSGRTFSRPAFFSHFTGF
nr:PREDICTED: high affinity immunoglobulin gamma Fc receptor I-like [Stegastes partitus]